MADPIFLNPNSFDNIKLILNEPKKMVVGDKKQWPVLVVIDLHLM